MSYHQRIGKAKNNHSYLTDDDGKAQFPQGLVMKGIVGYIHPMPPWNTLSDGRVFPVIQHRRILAHERFSGYP